MSSIFVLEREPYWTPELQRQFLATNVMVRGFQKWPDLAAAIHSTSPALAVVNYDDFPAECLTGLAAINKTPLIVVSSPRYAELEFVLRDAGLVAFFPDLPTGAELARCCRRWIS